MVRDGRSNPHVVTNISRCRSAIDSIARRLRTISDGLAVIAENGFPLQKEAVIADGAAQAHYIQSHRQSGETLGVWIEPGDAATTVVKVGTQKSQRGYFYQKKWDADIIAAIRQKLGIP
jgi:hypothetical protein